jgi:hypothetical protein
MCCLVNTVRYTTTRLRASELKRDQGCDDRGYTDAVVKIDGSVEGWLIFPAYMYVCVGGRNVLCIVVVFYYNNILM